jgi:hypothetical protein
VRSDHISKQLSEKPDIGILRNDGCRL